MASDEMEEIFDEFLAESREGLEVVYRCLLALDRDPSDRAALDAIFRGVHTIKGTAGFLGLDHIVALARSAENLLSSVRDGQAAWTPAAAALMFHAAEALRAELRRSRAARPAPAGAVEGPAPTMGSVWSRFPLLVRDLAAACGKEVRLDMHGAGTRLTRHLAEVLADPLAHLVRNAVDHGAETPAERRRAGKPVPARLSLRAWEEGDRVHIEVADDGPGVDLDRVRARAGEPTGTDQELLQLIFRPGFTTAERVTDISGRGVGLDVVRTDIEAAGGTVSVSSRPGAGTTFHLCVPVAGARPGGPAPEAGRRTTS